MMRLVSTRSDHNGVTLWVVPKEGSAPRNLRLSWTEAAQLVTDIGAGLATKLEREALASEEQQPKGEQ